MRLFYSTCPAGLEEPARRLAADTVPGFSPKDISSGAILFSARTDRPESPGFSNTYLQIARIDKCQSVLHASKLFLTDRRALSDAEKAMNEYGFASFRAMFSEANRLAPVDKEYRVAFEQAIRIPSNRAEPDTELTVLHRSNGNGLLLLRLTRPSKARKGELSRALASCLAYLTHPEKSGRFLDPFAGSGAIGIARMALSGSERIFLSDADPVLVQRLRQRMEGRAETECLDALTLTERFREGEFTEIAADPPWGLYRPIDRSTTLFCSQILENLSWVLAPYGRCVVLTAMKSEFALTVKEHPELELLDRFDILVNGKKAAIFVMRKRPPEASE